MIRIRTGNIKCLKRKSYEIVIFKRRENIIKEFC